MASARMASSHSSYSKCSQVAEVQWCEEWSSMLLWLCIYAYQERAQLSEAIWFCWQTCAGSEVHCGLTNWGAYDPALVGVHLLSGLDGWSCLSGCSS